MSFQIHSLPAEDFADMTVLYDAQLAEQNACRQIVQPEQGKPCRVSMDNEEGGETVPQLNYEHQPAQSPYLAPHAIFVLEAA